MEKFKLEDIKGMKVLIMGLGLNGGGLENARFFAQQGAEVLVTDLKDETQLSSSVASLSQFKNITFHLGRHEKKDFAESDLVIKNPGVKREGNEYLDCAKWIESDISIFSRLISSPIIAVTGTKGKSSTSTAIHYCLSKLGAEAFLAGNMGMTPLRYLSSATVNTPFVLELSSWQLADLKSCQAFHPHIALITPIMRDHQNWYGNMTSYVKDKSIIYQNQTQEDFLILNHDDEWSRGMACDVASKIFWYTKNKKKETSDVHKNMRCAYIDDEGNGVVKTEDGTSCILIKEPLKVKGVEARQNLLNAALAVYFMGYSPSCIQEVMTHFEGIEHRMECFFKTKNNISFYNDSAATIPEASCVALSAFLNDGFYNVSYSKGTDSSACRPIWIAGGTDKMLDFSPLTRVAKNAKKIFLLKGSATDKMIKVFEAEGIEYHGPYADLSVLLNEVKLQVERGEIARGENVVFSPASASFELFKNEFDRGNTFKALVKEMFASC